mmetsp:Transcript_33518/g.34017  ORF Transcript_33518/g.34017 Transcript_33518/m.34017 type:complete len:85 (+) Transcript_33518:191-445(+)
MSIGIIYSATTTCTIGTLAYAWLIPEYRNVKAFLPSLVGVVETSAIVQRCGKGRRSDPMLRKKGTKRAGARKDKDSSGASYDSC